jgi:hypothetical protein
MSELAVDKPRPGRRPGSSSRPVQVRLDEVNREIRLTEEKHEARMRKLYAQRDSLEEKLKYEQYLTGQTAYDACSVPELLQHIQVLSRMVQDMKKRS